MSRRRQLPFADGSTAFPTIVADGNSPPQDWPGGNGAVFAVGASFGGGTATLQMLAPDNATWLSLGTGTVFTAAGLGGFTAPAGMMRLNVLGSTAPSIKAWVVGIPTNN